MSPLSRGASRRKILISAGKVNAKLASFIAFQGCSLYIRSTFTEILSMEKLILDGNSLTVEDVHRCSLAPSSLSFAPAARRRIEASRRVVEEWIRLNETIYGVTTGVGEFSNVRINQDDIEQLQKPQEEPVVHFQRPKEI